MAKVQSSDHGLEMLVVLRCRDTVTHARRLALASETEMEEECDSSTNTH